MDELNTPLGLDKTTRRHFPPIAKPLFVCCLAVLTGAAAYATWIGNPFDAEPGVAIELAAVAPEPADSAGSDGLEGSIRKGIAKPERTYTTSDPSEPARLEEPELPDETITGGIIIRDAFTNRTTASLSTRPDAALVEKTSFGLLPKRADDGKRPLDAYARPVESFGAAKIAIVVGGLGLSQSGTKMAIERLPADVTLGFATAGNSLRRWMEKARKDGHELVLQLPMEPLGYPAINPGERTLLSSVPAEETVENLRWQLGRMTNYSAVMNYLGAKLTTEPAALFPIFDEINRRGLAFIDDGVTRQSQTGEIAREAGLPYARASVTIDERRSAGDIDKQLKQLEKLARRGGGAIGVGSAFQVTVDRIAHWAKDAEKRGFEIVPVSALISDPAGG